MAGDSRVKHLNDRWEAPGNYKLIWKSGAKLAETEEIIKAWVNQEEGNIQVKEIIVMSLATDMVGVKKEDGRVGAIWKGKTI